MRLCSLTVGYLSIPLLLFPSVVAALQRPTTPARILDCLVKLKDGLSAAEVDKHYGDVEELHKLSLEHLPGPSPPRGITRRYTFGPSQAYAGQFFDSVAQKIQTAPGVDFVELDADGKKSGAVVKDQGTEWSLARISKKDYGLGDGDRANSYTYDSDGTGRGMYAYVLDSGINDKHQHFGGRVRSGEGTNVLEEGGSTDDDDGHGTGVAGVIGSAKVGVLKEVSLIPVKISTADRDRKSDLLAGLDWTLADIRAKRRQGVSVVNLSTSFRRSQLIDHAVKELFREGTLCVAAAGNGEADATLDSPGGSPYALTAAGIDSYSSAMDDTNFGPAVDVFAPSEDVLTTARGTTTGTTTMDGTSFAAPHVAGLVLYFAQVGQGPKDPYALKNAIIEYSVKGQVFDCPARTANRIAFNNEGERLTWT